MENFYFLLPSGSRMLWTVFKVLFQLVGVMTSVYSIIDVREYNEMLWTLKRLEVPSTTVLIFPTIHRSLWFIGFIIAFGFQLLSIIKSYGSNGDKQKTNSLHLYFASLWLTIALGYPSMVSIFWKTYTNTQFSSGFLVISLIPVMAWFFNKTELVLLSLQLTSFVSFFANMFICAINENYYGVYGGACVFLALLALSLNRQSLIPRRELLIFSTTAATIFFRFSLNHILNEKQLLKKINI